jgi:hypothetical protein
MKWKITDHQGTTGVIVARKLVDTGEMMHYHKQTGHGKIAVDSLSG